MLTPRGAILLGASLALIVLGLLRTDGVLLTLGASGGILLAGAWILIRLNLKRLSLSLRAPTRIYADHPFDLRVFLHDNRRLLDAFSIKINLRLAGQVDIHTFAPWTAAHSISATEPSTSPKKIWAIPARRSGASDTRSSSQRLWARSPAQRCSMSSV